MVTKNGLKTPRGPASPPYAHGPYEWDQTLIQNKPTVDSYKRYVLEENFHRRPALSATISAAGWDTEATRNANINFEILGTGSSDDDVTFSATVAGLQLQTDGSSADQIIVLPHLGLAGAGTSQTAWSKTPWGTENQVIWECIIRTGASVADVTIWAGLKLTNTEAVATDDDSIYFRFDTGETTWECVNAIDGTDVETASGVTVAASTIYYLRIEIDRNRIGHYFINNKEVGRSAALTNDIDLIPYVGIQADAGSAKDIVLVKEKISRIIYE